MGAMECHRCLDGEAGLAKLTYANGDVQKMFLCDGCVGYFEADESVQRVQLAQTA